MKLDPQHAAEGSSWITYALAAIGGALSFFDSHAAGFMAMAAILTALVNWWYRHQSHKQKHAWDGSERRQSER